MWWIAWWAAVTVIGASGVVAAANSVRFNRRVAREVQEMAAASLDPPAINRQHLAGLPAPVRRYLTKAIGARQRGVRIVRLRHGGTFRTSLVGSWLRIRGEEYCTADPPGFIWHGRVRLGPGLWVDARDRSIHGLGNMFIAAESTITLGDVKGPELDQGALVRLLGEMAWFPTTFLDDRYVRWSAIDEHHASATLTVNDRTVSGVIEFGADDLPATFSAERYRDLGGGKAVPTPFLGRTSDYREIDGLLVPFHVVAAWIVDGKTAEYVRFAVERLEFDVSTPFGGNP